MLNVTVPLHRYAEAEFSAVFHQKGQEAAIIAAAKEWLRIGREEPEHAKQAKKAHDALMAVIHKDADVDPIGLLSIGKTAFYTK